MVTFERNGSTINIIVDTGLGSTLPLSWNCGRELYAKLLIDQLSKKQWSDNVNFARQNYEQGWKDKASHKKKKREWHPGNIYWKP